jgi:hypothetical protein
MSRWLIDTSALAQRGHPAVHKRLAGCIEDGATVCDMVVAESFIRARSVDDLAARKRFFDVMDVLLVDRAVWAGVTDIAERLAAVGKTVATGDAIIAACAIVNDVTVLHYDADYEAVGAVVDLAHEWVVPAGTL